MPDYRYEAIAKDGRSVKGKMISQSERDVLRSLRDQGLTPITVKETTKAAEKRKLFQGPPKTKDYILVIEELAVLLESGVPLADSVASIASSGIHPDITIALSQINQSLRRGEKFSDSLKKFMPKLPAYVQQLVTAGEMTGDVDSALKDCAHQMQYELNMKQEIKSALTYPVILVVVGLGAIVFVFMTVVPKFQSMFEGRDDIPGLTKSIISAGSFFNENTEAIAIGIAVFVALMIFAFKQPKIKLKIMQVVPNIPLLGAWFTESETGKWATTLSILLKNKIGLMDALGLARAGLTLPSFQNQMKQVETAVRGGKSLAKSLTDHTQLTALSLNLVEVGEKAGQLPKMLGSLASIYDRAGKDRMRSFLALIEPLSIVVIAGGIGLIFAGIVLGMTSITETNV